MGWADAPVVDTPADTPRWQLAPPVEPKAEPAAPQPKPPAVKPVDFKTKKKAWLSEHGDPWPALERDVKGLARGTADLVSMPFDALSNAAGLLTAGTGRLMGAAGVPSEKLPQVPAPNAFSSTLKRQIGAESPPPTGRGQQARDIFTEMLPSLITGGRMPTKAPQIPGPVKNVGPEFDIARKALKEGAVIPPKDIPGAGPLQRTAGAIGGKQRTEQTAQIRNQEAYTNLKVKRELGIAQNEDITPAALKQAQLPAEQAYDALKSYPGQFKTDSGFRNSIDRASRELIALQKKNPDLVKTSPDIAKMADALKTHGPFEPREAMGIITRLREQGRANLAAAKRGGDAEKTDLGKFQLAASKALEDMVERNLARSTVPGAKGLLKDYKEGRQLFAKVFDIARATDGAGNVDARALANLARGGKKLTGNLKDVAEFAGQFKTSAMRPPAGAGEEGLTIFDMWYAGGELAAGHPLMAATSLMRPTIRGNVALGKPMQRVPDPRQLSSTQMLEQLRNMGLLGMDTATQLQPQAPQIPAQR